MITNSICFCNRLKYIEIRFLKITFLIFFTLFSLAACNRLSRDNREKDIAVSLFQDEENISSNLFNGAKSAITRCEELNKRTVKDRFGQIFTLREPIYPLTENGALLNAAIYDLKKVLAINPDLHEVKYYLSKAYWLLDDKEEAVRWAKSYAESLKSEEAYIYLASLIRGKSFIDMCEDWYRDVEGSRATVSWYALIESMDILDIEKIKFWAARLDKLTEEDEIVLKVFVYQGYALAALLENDEETYKSFLKKAITIDPESESLIKNKIEMYIKE